MSDVEDVSLREILEAVHLVRDEVRIQRGELDEHRTELDALKKQINGSKPPPSDDDAPPVPIAKQLAAVHDELRKQSSAMGLAGLLEWLASPGAAAKALRIAGTMTAFYTALHAAGVVK